MIEEIEDDELTPEQRELFLAYKRVFGTDESRSKAQRLVWEDLWNRWSCEKPSFIPNTDHLSSANQLKNVVTYDPLKAALTDGAKMVIFQIQEFLRRRTQPKNKPKVKK